MSSGPHGEDSGEHVVTVRDALIAATAAVHGLTVVTRNVADFESTGVELMNPWLSREPRV